MNARAGKFDAVKKMIKRITFEKTLAAYLIVISAAYVLWRIKILIDRFL